MIKPSLLTASITLVILLIIGVLIYYAITTTNSTSRIILIISIIIMIIPIFKMPLKTNSNKDEIRIKHLIGSTNFSTAEFDINEITKSDLGSTIRLFGSGGFGGFIGWFRSDKIGGFYALYSNPSKLLLLKNKKTGKQYVIDAQISE